MCVWIAFWVALMLAASCSSKTTRYRVLSFFFDGVPDPNAPVLEKLADSPSPGKADKVQKPRREIFAHKPWRENKCRDCHNPDNGMLYETLEKGLCQSCHPEVPGDTAYVHGPVAINDCLSCHDPHKSQYPGLLRDDAKLICFRCHNEADLTKGPGHKSIGEVACIECHDPHGGNDPLFLRQREP